MQSQSTEIPEGCTTMPLPLAEGMLHQQLLQLVIDNLPECTFWKDQNSVYWGCNQNFAEIAGVDTPENIIGKNDFDLVWKPEETAFFRFCDRRVMDHVTAEQGLACIYQLDPSLPQFVYAEEKRLRQILINLLGNAAKFTNKGKVTLTVKAVKAVKAINPIITRSPQVHLQRIRFQVADTGGVGISPLEPAQIFSPFEQVGDKNHRAEGTGLSLAISQKMSIKAGGNDFLPKPVNAQVLFSQLATHRQLTWKYAEATQNSDPAEPTKVQVAPPEKELQALCEMAQQGWLIELERKAQAIGQTESKYLDFSKELENLVKQFDAERIEFFLQRYLSPPQSSKPLEVVERSGL